MGGNDLSAEERKEYLDLAITQQRRLAQLVRAQFDLALLESGAFPIDRQLASVSDLVSDVRDMFLATATAAQIELSVESPPSGIAETDIDRVFDPYFRAGSRVTLAAGGTGLGLAIAKRIVDLHGGRIRVISTTGLGAIFECRLPA